MEDNRLLRLGLVVSLLAITIYHDCQACSVPKRWKKQEVSKRAKMADIVIVGKVDRSPYRGSAREWQPSTQHRRGLYKARFEILCAIKGGPLPKYVNVSGFGRVRGHCVNSRARLNSTYIALLRKRRGRYFVAEINSQRATVPLKKHVLRRVRKRLGIKSNACSGKVKKFEEISSDVRYRNEVDENHTQDTSTFEWKIAAQSMRGDGLNAARTMKPVLAWVVPVLHVIQSLRYVPT